MHKMCCTHCRLNIVVHDLTHVAAATASIPWVAATATPALSSSDLNPGLACHCRPTLYPIPSPVLLLLLLTPPGLQRQLHPPFSKLISSSKLHQKGLACHCCLVVVANDLAHLAATAGTMWAAAAVTPPLSSSRLSPGLACHSPALPSQWQSSPCSPGQKQQHWVRVQDFAA